MCNLLKISPNGKSGRFVCSSPLPNSNPPTTYFFFFFEGIWHTSQTVSTTEGEINEMVVVVVT